MYECIPWTVCKENLVCSTDQKVPKSIKNGKKKHTISISTKLVLELRRWKLSRAFKTPAETAGFPLTWGLFELSAAWSADFSESSEFSDLDKSDLDRIFDVTKVLNVFIRLWDPFSVPNDFFRIFADMDMLELRLTGLTLTVIQNLESHSEIVWKNQRICTFSPFLNVRKSQKQKTSL